MNLNHKLKIPVTKMATGIFFTVENGKNILYNNIQGITKTLLTYKINSNPVIGLYRLAPISLLFLFSYACVVGCCNNMQLL